MTDQKHHLRTAAIEGLMDIAQRLPADCEMFLIACRPSKSDFDLVLPSPEANLNNALDALRRNGLSIDGDNAYKRDLCDSIVGALAFGAQDGNPPPAGHWAQRFFDMGREVRASQEALIQALAQVSRCLAGPIAGVQISEQEIYAAMTKADEVLAQATGTATPTPEQ
ncbi:hypothetical protein [Pseudomonas gingeri]|uniref:hypothetical protein n=1 Tax=Pseudomonas gingeri TaxID=117681 RepID=UPI0015B80300|nr:hypothetical protein [Pseudomonas gingeri]NWD49074.1 hypothetical protein [Pseudomonas gingeri]